jgi:hypothetical protein
MKLYQSLIAVCLTLLSVTSYADKEDLTKLQQQSNDWYIVKQDNTRQITTYAKHEDGKSIRSFKIDARVDASLETLAGVHFDIPNIKKWYWETVESKLISKVSDTEYIYYMKFNTPLAPDRDVVIRAKIEPYRDSHPYMVLHLRAAPSLTAIPEGVTRISAFDMDIKFTPLVNGQTQMDAEGYIDPSGNLPAWTVNLFQRQAPYSTMLGLYRMIQKPEYANPKTALAFKYVQ